MFSQGETGSEARQGEADETVETLLGLQMPDASGAEEEEVARFACHRKGLGQGLQCGESLTSCSLPQDESQLTSGCCACDSAAYISTFTTTSDPRPPNSCLCCIPACYLRPSSCERRYLPPVYYLLGAHLLRWVLKTTCYRGLHPLRDTSRGTVERREALIMLLPMTMGIELGHSLGFCLHLGLLLPLYLLGRVTAGSLGWQCGLIYVVHVLPICVQRLNRGQAPGNPSPSLALRAESANPIG